MKDLNQHQRGSEFGDLDLLECIDRGLEKFGRSVKQTIYWKISILYGTPQETIISNPSVFVQLLRNTFRDSAVGIEKVLLNEIVSRFGSLEDSGTLEDTLKTIRDQLGSTHNVSLRMILIR